MIKALIGTLLFISAVPILFTLIIPINEWPGYIDYNTQGEMVSLFLNGCGFLLNIIILALLLIYKKRYSQRFSVTRLLFGLLLLVNLMQIGRLIHYFKYWAYHPSMGV